MDLSKLEEAEERFFIMTEQKDADIGFIKAYITNEYGEKVTDYILEKYGEKTNG